MIVLAIDPGNVQSAYVLYNTHSNSILEMDIVQNDKLIEILSSLKCGADHLAIEMVASYGMAVGATVFETCVWIGQFIREWGDNKSCTKIYRKDVKMYLCQSMRAKDSNIRQAIIDRFPASGGGAVPQVGTKSNPGPLFGASKDKWAAIGVALTYANGGYE